MATAGCTHPRPEPDCDSCRAAELTAQVNEFRELYDRRLARLTANLREDLADDWAARNQVRIKSGLPGLPVPQFLRDPRDGQQSSDAAVAAAVLTVLALLFAVIVASLAASQDDGGKKGRNKSAGAPPTTAATAEGP